MSAEAAAPTPPDKTRRAVVLATVGVVVILGLAVFYVAVVAPLRETHKVVREWLEALRTLGDYTQCAETAVARLGGPERAVSRLGTYLRLPRWMKPDRPPATYMLGGCGRRAVPMLVRALGDRDAEVRRAAAYALHQLGPEAEEAVPALAEALVDADSDARWAAAAALGQIGPEAKEAVPALIEALEDADVRGVAAQALGRIGPNAKAAVPALEKLRDSPKEPQEVRDTATEALAKIRGEEPAPPAPAAPPAAGEE